MKVPDFQALGHHRLDGLPPLIDALDAMDREDSQVGDLLLELLTELDVLIALILELLDELPYLLQAGLPALD